jgi:uncharacterized protein
MTPEKQALITYRLERARQALEEAALLLGGGHANAYVNRLYYACFYAVSALLLTQNISTSKHRHLRTLFHQDYVKLGLVPVALGKHFDLLFDSRYEGDYEDFVLFKVETVQSWFEPTKSFVDHIADLIAREVQRNVP